MHITVETQLIFMRKVSANGTDYCENTGKITDVVYHEYGHAINGNRYNSGTGMWNGALNEGFADIWAFTITLDPVLGIGFYQNNPNGYVRRFDINKKSLSSGPCRTSSC